ncbi:MAG: hypothetical protein AMXMBFR47_12020 [Planctomycetota bacterium]
MENALIGYTGFVGSTLHRQARFDALFNSKNIGEVRGRSFDLVVCAAARAEKWKANAEPEADRAHIESLAAVLRTLSAKTFVLISTVDVYPRPIGVDESTEIELESVQPYGRHRLLLERHVQEHFSNVFVMRLPGLFGRGLKKNFIFDLLSENTQYLKGMHAQSRFQFYDMERLWSDIQRQIAAGIRLLNVSTEPVACADVARVGFDRVFENVVEKPPILYDMRSRHARALAGRDHYLYTAAETLEAIRRFRLAAQETSP